MAVSKDDLSDADKELLKSSDYVLDSIFGVVPKDVETRNRLQAEADAAAVKQETAEVKAEAKKS